MSELRQDDVSAWTIDQVVFELCHNPTPRWVAAGLPDIPARQQLEKTLRSNHIDGSLLLELSLEDLKTELNIRSLGQRKAIEKAIRFFRGEPQPSATPAPFLDGDRSRRTENWIPTPDNSRFSFNQASPAWETGSVIPGRPSLERSLFGDSPKIPSRELATLPKGTAALESNTDTSLALQPTSAGNATRASFSPVRREVALSSNIQTRPVSDQIPPRPIDVRKALLPQSVKAEIDNNSVEKEGVDNIGELLDNLEAHVVGNLWAPADVNLTSTQDFQHADHGTQSQGPKQQRRVAPTLVGPARPEHTVQMRQQSHTGSAYLNHDALLMQTTFYGGDGDEDRDFSFLGSSHSKGQTAVVANRINKFMLSKPIPVPGLDYDAVARIPYRPQVCVRPSRAYFTLFAQNVAPSIQLLKDWPALLQHVGSETAPSKPSDISRSDDPATLFEHTFSGAIDDSNSSDLGDFAYLLDKYPVAENDDSELLPAYGDSGDENEYDEATWAEITAEKEEKKHTSAFLSHEEAVAAIEEAVEALREKWRTHKQAKVQMKSYRLWIKVAKARRREDDIQAQYSTRNRKLAYLEKMKEHILKDRWRSADQIKQQCESLEETLYQVMEAEHLLTVLHQDHAPEKPQPQTPRRKVEKPALQDDEEILESESEPDPDPPMEGFVVDDDGDVPMPDHQSDPDFNPVIPHAPISIPLHEEGVSEAKATSEMNDTSSPVLQQQEPAKAVPDIADSPGDDADDEIDAFDADDVDDVDDKVNTHDDMNTDKEDDIIGSTDKRRRSLGQYAAKEPIHSDDWSSATKSARMNSPTTSDDDNSDLDAPSRLPPSIYKSKGKSFDTAIELLSSDPALPDDQSTGAEYTVETPPLNTPDSNEEEQNPKSRPVVKLKFRLSSEQPTGDIDKFRAERLAVLEAVIRGFKPNERQQLSDLIRNLKTTKLKYAKSKEIQTLPELIREGLLVLHTGPADSGNIRTFHVEGVSEDHTGAAHMLTLLIVSYINRKNFIPDEDHSIGDVNRAFSEREAYISAFSADLYATLRPYSLEAPSSSKKPQKGKHGDLATGKKRKRIVSDDEIEILESGFEETEYVGQGSDTYARVPRTPHAKKKKKVAQSKLVRDTQKDDQLRVQEQEDRRAQLFQKLRLSGSSSVSIDPINAQEPLIYLDDHIQTRVKPHQVKGIQFLWGEIVSDPKHQGCLLAHTMGLGKTMQVISLLVTIAQSRLSSDSDIVSQLPAHIQENNKTLILCPPSLLDNWYDELLMWSPPKLLGIIFKIAAGRTAESSFRIRRWASGGGVLVMSYETFRSLLLPGKQKHEHRAQVPEYEKLLLESPSIVVADEAHKLKNATSKISLVAKRFTTRSRIALTGSPLNNHLEEYHTMVEWIAPNYLGDMDQFRSKYVDPITAGLYTDSSAYERRVCLRKLHVLKNDLEPKVNRADITAIRDDMPPKTEYIITIPLAEKQRKAYDLYVGALLEHSVKHGTAATSLFKWLNKLIILANHPSCFIKLYDKYEEIEQSNGYESSTDVEKQTEEQATQELKKNLANYDPLNDEKVSKFDSESMRKAVEVFHDQLRFQSMEDSELSFRTDLARKILTRAVSIGDKTLVFSQSIPTLDYLEKTLIEVDPKLMRIDGGTAMSKRQKMTKDFNQNQASGEDAKIILISTRAGGLGLNLQGANRVIIFDSGFNPMWEEQAVGRAYRLGQITPVFVYRFKCGGTFEEAIYNKALFKTQLFQRVVDKKNPTRAAEKSVTEYLFLSRDIKKQNFSEHIGRDPMVLDSILAEVDYVHNLELTETFQRDDGEALNDEELKQANDEYEDERLRREDPKKWQEQQMATYRPMASGGPASASGASVGAGRVDTPGGSARLEDRRNDGKRPANGKSAHVSTVMTSHGTGRLYDLSSGDVHKAQQAKKDVTIDLTDPYDYFNRPGPRLGSHAHQVDGAGDDDSTGSDSISIEQISKGRGDKRRAPAGCENQ